MFDQTLKRAALQYIPKIQSAWYARAQQKLRKDMLFTEAWAYCGGRNQMHAYMHHYFHQLAPDILRAHRSYFKVDMRGFGEDAFHAMWYTLLKEFKPKRCLEIGVYRGQVISLWALIARSLNYEIEIHGVAPFEPAGDQVSQYLKNIDYQQDVLSHHRHFDLKEPSLLRAYSTDERAREYIGESKWDLIYIDGNHDYEIALADYLLCRDSLAVGGLLIMDDSSLYTDFNPPTFSFAGHPGPSKIVKDLAIGELKFIGAVGHNNVFQKKP